MEPEVLVDELTRERDAFFEALASVSEESMTTPGLVGEWSGRDLIAHVGYWVGHATDVIHLFETGRIYWSGQTGARALWGLVLAEYLSRGAAAGALGFPTKRVHRVGGKATADFQHGTIACADGGACTVS